MGKKDIRKSHPEEQYELRKQVVRLRKNGRSVSEISEVIGFCPTHISTIWQKYKKGGLKALRSTMRGRKHGDKRKLTSAQEKNIKKMIIEKTPDQLNLSCYLWTREAIYLAIKQEFDVDVPLSTISDYLKRWRFNPQEPTTNTNKENIKGILRWFEAKYPDIIVSAKEENAEIQWGDDTGSHVEVYYEDGLFGPIPMVRRKVKKDHVNMISSVNNRKKIRFMLYRGDIDENIFTNFLKRLNKDCKRNIYFILYRNKIHRSPLVKGFLMDKRDNIRLIYLPSKLPEIDPVGKAHSSKNFTHKKHES